MYICVCLHVYMLAICVQGLKRPEEGIKSPRTEVKDNYKLSYRCWKPNLGPLDDQRVLSTAEPSLLPLAFHLQSSCLSFSSVSTHSVTGMHHRACLLSLTLNGSIYCTHLTHTFPLDAGILGKIILSLDHTFLQFLQGRALSSFI